jgi:hypothetical protein
MKLSTIPTFAILGFLALMVPRATALNATFCEVVENFVFELDSITTILGRTLKVPDNVYSFDFDFVNNACTFTLTTITETFEGIIQATAKTPTTNKATGLVTTPYRIKTLNIDETSTGAGGFFRIPLIDTLISNSIGALSELKLTTDADGDVVSLFIKGIGGGATFDAEFVPPPAIIPGADLCTTLGTALEANDFVLNFLSPILGLPIPTIIPTEIISLEFEPIISVTSPDDCNFTLTFASTLLDGSFSAAVSFGKITTPDNKTMIVTDIEVDDIVLPSAIEPFAAIPVQTITEVLDQLEQIVLTPLNSGLFDLDLIGSNLAEIGFGQAP